MTPAELLASLKEAPGPSAELNVRIWALINGYEIGFVEQAQAYRAYKGDDAIWVAEGGFYREMTWREYIGLNTKFPNFTGSLDATKAAIKGKWPEFRIAIGEGDIVDAVAALWTIKPDTAAEIIIEEEAPDLERALCAALVAGLMEEGK